MRAEREREREEDQEWILVEERAFIRTYEIA